MENKTVIFFGKSGAGKGTQAKLLRDKLEAKDSGTKTLYIETGAKLREFMENSNLTAHMVKKVLDEGKFLPSFLPIWLWTGFFVENYSGSEHLILDGLSRRQHEAPVLDGALRFYDIKNPIVILIDVSREWSTNRLMERGRYDDNKDDIEERLDAYDNFVVPTITFFENNSDYYDFHKVNGERSIDEVQSEINKIVFGE